jgi:hypothetical protein
MGELPEHKAARRLVALSPIRGIVTMHQLGRMAFRMIWGITGVIVAAGWAVYGLVGSNSNVFLAVMVAVTIVLYGSTAVLVRRRQGA